jgi:N-acyl-L-homoserine lactone synthetase
MILIGGRRLRTAFISGATWCWNREMTRNITVTEDVVKKILGRLAYPYSPIKKSAKKRK